MDYNSTFLGLIVAGVILVAIGFGMVLTQPTTLRPAAAIMATERPARETITGTVGDARSFDRIPARQETPANRSSPSN